MKFFKQSFFVVLISVLCVSNVHADTIFYYVYDTDNNINEQFESYYAAKAFYDENVDEYQNLVLAENDKVLEMEYGVVAFETDGCPLGEYYSLKRNESDMISGCYGDDGLYLSSNSTSTYFYLSNDEGRINTNDIYLVPFNENYVSSYYVKDNYLYHNIVATMNGYYSYSLVLDKDVKVLKNNHKYYSYDGHYFYDDFYTMSDDYRNDIRDNAVNSEEPYFNYFQYLPYRTLSNYSASDFDHYLKEEMNFMGMLSSYNDNNGDGANDVVNRSQLYNVANTVKANEIINGTNALLTLSAAINDSDFGKSRDSFYLNSLFYSVTFNNDFARETGYFNTVNDSINNYSHFTINKYFANRRSISYYGTYLGDKLGGLTVDYSSDPYYGERVASIAFTIDEKLGSKDNNEYALAFANNSNVLYEDEYLEDYLYTLNNRQAVYPLLYADEDISMIQLDQPLKDFGYSYKDNVAYLDIEEVLFVLNEDRIKEKEYVSVHVDFDGGKYEDHEYLDICVSDEDDVDSIIPEKEGYVFKSYLKTYDTENEVWNYVAEYKEIEMIALNDVFDKTLNIGDYIDFNDSSIMVKYNDGSGDMIPVTSNMFDYYENDYEHTESVCVDYHGVKSYFDIEVKDMLSETKDEVNRYLENEAYTELKKLLFNKTADLSWNQIRTVDEYLENRHNRNYVMSLPYEDADISVSGLDLSLEDRSTFSLIEDIYYLNFVKENDEAAKTIMNAAKPYDFEMVGGVDISFKFNYEKIEMHCPIIVQMKVADKNINGIYTVYHLDTNNQVIKCKSVHTNDYVIFEADEEGTYLVLTKDSFNTFDFINGSENLRYEDTGLDEHRINIEFLLVMAIVVANFIGIAIYYIINSRKDEKWRDYKKLLQTQASAPEEKRKN